MRSPNLDPPEPESLQVMDGRASAGEALHHSILARMLAADIQAGRYAVGDKLPSEAELQKRFDASRYAVREAIRHLKEQGLVWARGGVGTVVRATAPQRRQMRGEGSIRELIQFADATRMQVLERRSWVADEIWALQYGGKPGQQWAAASILRRLPEQQRPMAVMDIFLRPEHADVFDQVESAQQPVFSLLQQHHGVQVVEVRQQIVAVNLDLASANHLQAVQNSPALLITRHYCDAANRILLLSLGRYPSDRFVHDTKFRVSD